MSELPVLLEAATGVIWAAGVVAALVVGEGEATTTGLAAA